MDSDSSETRHIFGVLERVAATQPDAVAVVDALGVREQTYGELLEAVLRRAGELRSYGVEPGDRVAIFELNRSSYLELYFAVAALGAISVPLNTRLAASELRDILADAEPRVLMVGAGLTIESPANLVVVGIGATTATAATTATVPAESLAGGGGGVGTAPADVAHIYYTSGTTGRAKGVMLTQQNVCTHAVAAVAELSLSARDTWAHIAPMFHLADAWATFAITMVGGRHVFLAKFDTVAALELLSTARVTITNLVPTMLNRMVRHESAPAMLFPRLRLMLSGGAPIAPAVVRQIIEVFGGDYVQTYGMTETSPYLTLSLLHDHLRALPEAERLRYKCKTGRPFQGVALRVVDECGRPVAADGRAIGEIQVCGPTVTPGYWRNQAATAAAFTADGWLQTGDLATLDAEGYVDIVDRKKDVILSGGETVYSVEVEAVLFEHPAVVEAAVFGRADDTWGEVVCAAIVAAEAVTADDLDQFCRRVLAAFKVPRRYEFLDALPRTGSGKISKRLLLCHDRSR